MTKLFTTASAAVLCALVGACAATPNFPVDNPNAGPPMGQNGYGATGSSPDGPAPRAAPTTSIQSGALPPPSGGQGLPPAYQPPPYYPPAAPAYTPSAPAYTPPRNTGPCPPGEMQRTITTPAPAAPAPARLPGSGKVVNDTPAPVKVAAGDTLIAISRKTGVLVKDLADLNDLSEPYRLRPGQSLKLPGKRYYTVVSGDTLSAVSRRFGVSVAALADFNDIDAGKGLRAGQKVNLPEGARDKGAPVAPKPAPRRPTTRTECVTDPNYVPYSPPRAPAPRPAPAPAPAPYQPSYSAPTPAPRPAPAPAPAYRPTPAPAPAPAPAPYRPNPAPTPMQRPAQTGALSDAQIAAAGRGRFVWPLQGEIINRFGPAPGGQGNDGVNIAANAGAGVRAAAKGEVVYAGNQIPGFGNLVLIKHDGGWVTAYAHLSNIDVKMRQTIAQSQIIGQAGQTGTVDRPQLHFEVRYPPAPSERAKPIDPLLVLPR